MTEVQEHPLLEEAVLNVDGMTCASCVNRVEQALRAANALKAGTPRPRLAVFDPVAVRALVVLLVVATFFAAAGERMKRITAAFDWAERRIAFWSGSAIE